jgi:hypothetical protein
LSERFRIGNGDTTNSRSCSDKSRVGRLFNLLEAPGEEVLIELFCEVNWKKRELSLAMLRVELVRLVTMQASSLLCVSGGDPKRIARIERNPHIGETVLMDILYWW